jgi:hypothetical protein
MVRLDRCPLVTWNSLQKGRTVSRFIQRSVEEIVEH